MWKDVRDTEREIIQECKTRLESAQRQLALAERAVSIKGSPGYDEFIQKVVELRDATIRELVGTYGVDSYLRVLQGKAQALGDVLAIMTRGDSLLTQLAEKAVEAQNALSEAQRRIPKQKPAETNS